MTLVVLWNKYYTLMEATCSLHFASSYSCSFQCAASLRVQQVSLGGRNSLIEQGAVNRLVWQKLCDNTKEKLPSAGMP